MLKAGPVMDHKECHFENCRLALGVVFCRVKPLGKALGVAQKSPDLNGGVRSYALDEKE